MAFRWKGTGPVHVVDVTCRESYYRANEHTVL